MLKAMDSVAPPVPIASRYQTLSLLGRGGMAEVHRVLDRREGREVALKRLVGPAASKPVVIELFEREFHTLSELAHPRIIAVYDYGRDDQGAYYTMELLGGQDLRELGKLPWRQACSLLRDIASSLAILHSRRLLHCDVSPRNVRCTTEGRAKLLDFGAMAPMGISKRVAGTPPFMAPEMVQLQALDARCDIFGLGALAYWVLTGRHAYPARSIQDLRDTWRRTPLAPMAIEPEIPPALSLLVMECLQLNRNARPRSASVVMERLCAIASLDFDEAKSAQAYLTTPTLIGRETQLALVRERLAMRPQVGSVFCIGGAPGSGRSRVLDACVLEAKLLGWTVLRADAGDASRGEYGAARTLCEQLYELAPERAKQAARLHAGALAHILGSDLVGVAGEQPVPSRRALLSALRDFILAVARPTSVFIAVDDADRIDETSASLLVALAQKTPRRAICLALTADSQADGTAALDALDALGQRLELPPLEEPQTEQLVHAVFGSAANTLTLARRVHTVAAGNPRTIMQLLEHLLVQGAVRYEAGAFLLPESLREQDLPPSLAAALERRLAGLDADALELARALALTDTSALAASSYRTITSHDDRTRTYRALDQLVRVQMLEPEGERYRFRDQTWRDVLSQGLDAALRKQLHARLAHVFELSGSTARRALHLMESEQPEAAIRVLLAQYLKDPNEPRDPLEDYVPGLLDLLERAAGAAIQLKLPAPMRVELRMKTAGASQFTGDIERFMRIAPPLLEELTLQSGLHDYGELSDAMEPMARLTEALTRVQQRFDATPEADRGLHPVDAIRELSRLCAMYAGVAAISLDVGLVKSVPSLDPLAPLSPAIAVIQRFVDATRVLLEGRSNAALEIWDALLRRLAEPDRAGLGELYHKSIQLGTLYIVGLIEASLGLQKANERVAPLEREPGHRVNAQRVHMVCALMQGDFDGAASAQRRAELVMLQDGQQQRYPGTTARTELQVHALVGDLAGVKQVHDRLKKAARAMPQWSVVVQLGLSKYRQLQGDLVGALEALEPALTAARPLQHRDFGGVVSAHVELLTALGRAAEAVELGLRMMELAAREGLQGWRSLAQHTAEAMLVLGRTQDAKRIAEALCDDVERSGVEGLALGLSYELRARVAIACADIFEFQQLAARCGQAYNVEHNPGLAGRYERLLREAKDAGLLPDAERASLPVSSPPRAADSSVASAVHSRLVECTGVASRAQCALMILAEHTGCEQGYLYGVREGHASFLCGVPGSSPPPELAPVVDAYLEQQLIPEEVTRFAEVETGAQHGTTIERIDTHLSGEFVPVLIASVSEGQMVVAGIVCLRFGAGPRHMPQAALLTTIATALLDNDDVDPMTRLA